MLPRREADMDKGDTFLPLLLGVVSLARRLDDVLETVPVKVEGGEPERSLASEDQATVYLLLGLIALRNDLGSHLAASPAGTGESSATESGSEVRGSLQRNGAVEGANRALHSLLR